MQDFRVWFEVTREVCEYWFATITADDIEHAKLIAADMAHDGDLSAAEHFPDSDQTLAVDGVYVDSVEVA